MVHHRHPLFLVPTGAEAARRRRQQQRRRRRRRRHHYYDFLGWHGGAGERAHGHGDESKGVLPGQKPRCELTVFSCLSIQVRSCAIASMSLFSYTYALCCVLLVEVFSMLPTRQLRPSPHLKKCLHELKSSRALFPHITIFPSIVRARRLKTGHAGRRSCNSQI